MTAVAEEQRETTHLQLKRRREHVAARRLCKELIPVRPGEYRIHPATVLALCVAVDDVDELQGGA